MFLFSLEDLKLKDQLIWKDLDLWVKSYAKTFLTDLVIPRFAWLNLVGLPFITVSDQVVESLIVSVRKTVNISESLEDSNQFLNIKVCITTKSKEKVKIVREVNIDNFQSEVWILEEEREKSPNCKQEESQKKGKITSWLDSLDNNDSLPPINQSEKCDLLDQDEFTEDSLLEEGIDINPEVQEFNNIDARMENWSHTDQGMLEKDLEEKEGEGRPEKDSLSETEISRNF